MKKLFGIILSLVTLSLAMSAADLATSTTKTYTNAQVSLVSKQVTAVDVYNYTTNTLTLYFYDSNTTNKTYSFGDYTTRTSTAGTTTSVYTNSLLTVMTNVFPSLTTTASTTSSGTANYDIMFSVNVPASSALRREFTTGVNFARGIYAESPGAITNWSAIVSVR